MLALDGKVLVGALSFWNNVTAPEKQNIKIVSSQRNAEVVKSRTNNIKFLWAGGIDNFLGSPLVK